MVKIDIKEVKKLIKFKIGDKVVYPSQGVGIVDFIEEKEFHGRREKYYKIHILNNTLKVMLPFSRAEVCHMRPISDSETLDSKLENIRDYSSEVYELAKINYKERNELYSIKVKSGTLEDYLEIICKLTRLKSIHNLNTMEKTILRNTKRIVIDEISQSKNLSTDEASNLLNLSISV